MKFVSWKFFRKVVALHWLWSVSWWGMLCTLVLSPHFFVSEFLIDCLVAGHVTANGLKTKRITEF